MRTFLAVLIAMHIVGVLAATIAAVVKIESIVFSGTMLGSTGLLIASLCFFRNLEIGFWYGLSLPSLALLCLLIITGFDLGPHEASGPIGTLIVLFTLADLPVGVLALRELRRFHVIKHEAKFQFRIATLLALMFLAAIVLGLFRIGDEFFVAMGITVLYTAMAAYTVRRFYRRRAENPIGDTYPHWQ